MSLTETWVRYLRGLWCWTVRPLHDANAAPTGVNVSRLNGVCFAGMVMFEGPSYIVGECENA